MPRQELEGGWPAPQGSRPAWALGPHALPLPFLSGCGGDLHAAQGTFSSPYHPAHYPPNINCTWNIEVGAVMGGRRRLEKVGGTRDREGEGGGGMLQEQEKAR